MRILSLNKVKWDKNYLFWLLIAFVSAIICGIVLFNISDFGYYIFGYAQNYVDAVFFFEVGGLIFSCLIKELLFIYAFFALAYFAKLKALSAVVMFLRTVVFALYCCVMFTGLGIGGGVCAVLVYIPCYIFSCVCCAFAAENYCIAGRRLVFVLPALLAVCVCAAFFIMHNVVFRILIALV